MDGKPPQRLSQPAFKVAGNEYVRFDEKTCGTAIWRSAALRSRHSRARMDAAQECIA
jgi:hypothetical protein